MIPYCDLEIRGRGLGVRANVDLLDFVDDG